MSVNFLKFNLDIISPSIGGSFFHGEMVLCISSKIALKYEEFLSAICSNLYI